MELEALELDARTRLISSLREFPAELEAFLDGLGPQLDEALAAPCEALHAKSDSFWTVGGTLHHIADSHLHAYTRVKGILLEPGLALEPWDWSCGGPYDAVAWQAHPSGEAEHWGDALDLLRGLHARWARLLEALPDAAWELRGEHPERGSLDLEQLLCACAEHGAGHLAKMRQAAARL